jgi:hypothetical protein
MVYGFEAVLPTDLEYGAPRIRAYDEQGNQTTHEEALEMLRYYTQLNTNKLYGATTPDTSGVEPLTSEIWY